MAKARRAGDGTAKGIKGASLGYRPAQPIGEVALAFRPAKELRYVRGALFRDVSALAVTGRTLFCACDETASVERLVLDEAGERFASHENFSLGDAFDLPDGPNGEMDIEGIAVDGGYLWITGSHSLKRAKTETGDDDLSALDDISWDANRGFLGRVPLYEIAPGVFEVVGRIETLGAEEKRRAACLKPDKKGHTILRDLLIQDRLLKPFMGVPSKENGFDIEGMAVLGERVFLGLRGPVIGSQALMVEVRLEATKKSWLKMKGLGGGSPYRLHAFDLGGLGVRDMVLCGERLLLLAGATMNFEGPQAVFVLDELPEEGGPIGADRLKRAIELPVTPGYDHAEGITPVEVGGVTRLMVVYDSPAPERVSERENTVTTDLFEMP